MQEKPLVVTANVPDDIIAAFVAAGWDFVASQDSPVVSGASVPDALTWNKDETPVIPHGHSISCPNEKGYCTIDGIA